MEDECFQKQTAKIKARVINTHTEACKELDLLANEKKRVVVNSNGHERREAL